jgi:hypothetical protein
MIWKFSFIAVLVLFLLFSVSCASITNILPDNLSFSCSPRGSAAGEPQITFAADRTSLQPGECATLEWDVRGDGVFGVDVNGEGVNSTGQKQVCPVETTAYTLSVDIGTTMLHREVVVNVAGTGQQPSQPQTPGNTPQQPQPSSPGCPGTPTFTTFEANPSTITSGQSTTLSWGSVTNGTNGQLVSSVVLTPGNFGEVGSPGSCQVSPTSTTTYTLTATGCGGTATKSVTVVVQVVGTPVPIPPPSTPSPGQIVPPLVNPVPIASKVTDVHATVTPSSYTGSCPKVFDLLAVITVDGPCTVTFQWWRSDGVTYPVESIVFTAAGSNTVTRTDAWQGQTGSGSFFGCIFILSPNQVQSSPFAFNVVCK